MVSYCHYSLKDPKLQRYLLKEGKLHHNYSGWQLFHIFMIISILGSRFFCYNWLDGLSFYLYYG